MAARIPLTLALALACGAPLRAQWSSTVLSEARAGLAAATVGDVVLFAGGESAAGPSAVVDVYDATLGPPTEPAAWSVAALSEARGPLAAATLGSKVFFAGGGTVVDVYDATLGPPSEPAAWSTLALSEPRVGLSVVAVGARVLFAGGEWDGASSDLVELWDDEQGLWSTARLVRARAWMGATVVGDRAWFAGGTALGLELERCADVDVYDATKGKWTTDTLSQARGSVAAAGIDGTALFAGGWVGSGDDSSDVVDLFAGSWSTTALSSARAKISATTVGSVALFAGGSWYGTPMMTVDLYNCASGEWTTAELSAGRAAPAAAALGETALFAGGEGDGGPSDVVDVFVWGEPLGASYCGPAPKNSLGLSAEIHGVGSLLAQSNSLVLSAEHVPPGQAGMFLVSRHMDFVPFVGGGQGHLCLGGAIGRFADRIQAAGPDGTLSIPVDLTDVPTPLHQRVRPGDTWYFQLWYRDTNPGPTSNLTDGLEITFQ